MNFVITRSDDFGALFDLVFGWTQFVYSRDTWHHEFVLKYSDPEAVHCVWQAEATSGNGYVVKTRHSIYQPYSRSYDLGVICIKEVHAHILLTSSNIHGFS